MTACGFYGKVPSEGDFVSRRLPWEFTSAWDAWLQRGVQASRATLGERWLEAYLSAPVWRFQLAPGVCGPQGWRGFFFASVDRVGRYFPLTVAAPDEPGRAPALATLAGEDERWLACEDVALAALDPRVALEVLDRAVEALALPAAAGVDADAAGDRDTDAPGPAVVCLYTGASDDRPAAGHRFPALPEAAVFASLLASR